MGLAVELQISMSGLGEYGGTHTGGNLAVDAVSGKTGSAKVVWEKKTMIRDVFLLHGLLKNFEDMEKTEGPILIESLSVENWPE